MPGLLYRRRRRSRFFDCLYNYDTTLTFLVGALCALVVAFGIFYLVAIYMGVFSNGNNPTKSKSKSKLTHKIYFTNEYPRLIEKKGFIDPNGLTLFAGQNVVLFTNYLINQDVIFDHLTAAAVSDFHLHDKTSAAADVTRFMRYVQTKGYEIVTQPMCTCLPCYPCNNWVNLQRDKPSMYNCLNGNIPIAKLNGYSKYNYNYIVLGYQILETVLTSEQALVFLGIKILHQLIRELFEPYISHGTYDDYIFEIGTDDYGNRFEQLLFGNITSFSFVKDKIFIYDNKGKFYFTNKWAKVIYQKFVNGQRLTLQDLHIKSGSHNLYSLPCESQPKKIDPKVFIVDR